MNAWQFDWLAVLSGQPLLWLLQGLGNTLALTLCAGLLASVLAALLLAMRLAHWPPLRWLASSTIALFRNTPLAVQLLFWYFGGLSLLPAAMRDWLNNAQPSFGFPSTELLVGIWSMGLFTAVFLAEELRAGVRAVAAGQAEAARAQGFSHWQSLRLIILPQALQNAWNPLIGQYLNLLKNSPLAMSIAVTELMYQANQIESYNFHGIEAYATVSAIYLLLGLLLSTLLTTFGPGAQRTRRNKHAG